MKQVYTIGIDIGGTNTDAVIIDKKQQIVFATKTPTTEDISLGFASVLCELFAKTKITPDQIQGVFLGTTHATNAILQKKDLCSVGLIRIAGQRPNVLPPGYAWPKDIKQTVIKGVETVSGGLECHGGALTPFFEKETTLAIKRLLLTNVSSFAVIGVFSPLDGSQEREVKKLILERAGKDFPVSLSHEIGGVGFIERENSTLLNASLKNVMKQGFQSLEKVCQNLKLSCPLLITQNDGSLISLQKAMDYPVLTISAGQANSFLGAARLSGCENAIVVDIGGTSTDVGLVIKGFPIRSLNRSSIGGISLNFSMPDILSIALGGGSVISFCKNEIKIGPESVAKAILSKAKAFGGDALTLTDAALACSHLTIPNADRTKISISSVLGEAIFKQVLEKISELITKISGEYKNLPVIIVGGGASLLPSSSFKKNYQIPSHYDVANAYGSSLGEISAGVDIVVSLEDRERVLSQLHERARQKAIDKGADPKTVRAIDEMIIPYHYVPKQMARVIVRYCGKKIEAPSKRSGILSLI